MNDVDRLLAALPRGTSDTARAARVQARCQAALAAQRQRAQAPPRPASTGVALLGVLCGVYLCEVLRVALIVLF